MQLGLPRCHRGVDTMSCPHDNSLLSVLLRQDKFLPPGGLGLYPNNTGSPSWIQGTNCVIMISVAAPAYKMGLSGFFVRAFRAFLSCFITHTHINLFGFGPATVGIPIQSPPGDTG